MKKKERGTEKEKKKEKERRKEFSKANSVRILHNIQEKTNITI